jgi:hypothetical protein
MHVQYFASVFNSSPIAPEKKFSRKSTRVSILPGVFQNIATKHLKLRKKENRLAPLSVILIRKIVLPSLQSDLKK